MRNSSYLLSKSVTQKSDSFMRQWINKCTFLESNDRSVWIETGCLFVIRTNLTRTKFWSGQSLEIDQQVIQEY